jgi:hypothetical protein
MSERNARIALAAVFFVYVLAIRTYDVATTFLMLGEQTRDWTIALGGITDLPLVGAPSTAGGRGFGPAYYWVLWLGRAVIGPFMDNLPHAGGITVALLQSAADTWLLLALSRRVHWGLALALCLLIASAPFDIAISSVIWNPPVAAAFIKLAIATALTLTPASPLSRVALTAAFAWLAVQCHLSAAFVAAPLLAGVAAQAFLDRAAAPPRSILERLRPAFTIAAVVAALQIPFVISLFTSPGTAAGPSGAIATLASAQAYRPLLAFDSVTGITGTLLMPFSDNFKFAIPVTLAGLILVARYRRDLIVIGATIGALLTATALFITWTRNYDSYWFITMTTSMTLLFGMTIAAIPSKAAVKWIGFALLAVVAWRQPSRLEDSKRYFKYPQYGTMVKASEELIAKAPAVRDIALTFEVHPTMDRLFMYKILGGEVTPTALNTATFNADGTVRLEF